MVGFLAPVLITAFTAVAGSVGLHKYNKGDYKEDVKAIEADPVGTAAAVKDAAVDTVLNIGETADQFGAAVLGVKDSLARGYDNAGKFFNIATAENPLAAIQQNFTSQADGSNSTSTDTPAEDGFDLMNAAKLVAGGGASVGIMSWLWNKVSSDDKPNNKPNNNEGGFSWGLALAVIGIGSTIAIYNQEIKQAIGWDSKPEPDTLVI